jgi:ribonuclease P protein component
LKNQRDIQAVFDQRDVFRGERLVFHRGKSASSDPDQTINLPENEFRFCLVVSKQCGGAVRRNRLKRILREIIRHNRQRITPGHDYIVRVNATRLQGTEKEKDFLGDFARYFGWN